MDDTEIGQMFISSSEVFFFIIIGIEEVESRPIWD